MSVYEGCLSYLRGGDRHYCFVKPVLKKDVLARTIWSLIKSVYTRNHTPIDFAAGCTMDNNISYCIIHGCTARFGIDVTVHLYPSLCVLLYRQPICDCKEKIIAMYFYVLYQRTLLIWPLIMYCLCCLAAVTHVCPRLL